ncbi:hypothetical protein CEXT_263441 [Caerostris extrusa]|uniref:Uncharacterized protein n=1 Tax=Caerostris extrusa TaxID=172846 RepID=A0AAV4SGR4_CAEEX|nr:hypothetical protein CEXT_263441 [Caerostris extrusa]
MARACREGLIASMQLRLQAARPQRPRLGVGRVQRQHRLRLQVLQETSKLLLPSWVSSLSREAINRPPVECCGKPRRSASSQLVCTRTSRPTRGFGAKSIYTVRSSCEQKHIVALRNPELSGDFPPPRGGPNKKPPPCSPVSAPSVNRCLPTFDTTANESASAGREAIAICIMAPSDASSDASLPVERISPNIYGASNSHVPSFSLHISVEIHSFL